MRLPTSIGRDPVQASAPVTPATVPDLLAESRIAIDWLRLLARDGLVCADAVRSLDRLADCRDAASAHALLVLIEDLLTTGEATQSARDGHRP